MATAESTTVTKSVDVEGLTLTLNDEEWQFLSDLLNRVGGHPDLSRRRHSDAIGHAMRAIKYLPDTGTDVSEEPGEGRLGAIYFTPVS